MSQRRLGAGSVGGSLRIAILGTRGIPANYGGFETCAHEVATALSVRGHDVTVYCRRSSSTSRQGSYRGVHLRYPPNIESKTLGTLSHALVSTADALRLKFDVLLYFNAGTAPAAAVARATGKAVVINVDGLEWQCGKWGRVGRSYYKFSEWLSAKVASRVISDSTVIQQYYERRWKAPSTYVAYGAHSGHAETPEVLDHYGLRANEYFFVLSRLEPENNAHLTVEAFTRVETDKQLVIVGGSNWDSNFVRALRSVRDPRIRFLDPVYDADHVRELYSGAFAYVHGNQVGGTNPALLQAMGYGCCVLALDVPFNAETVGDAAILYDSDADDLAEKMRTLLVDEALAETYRKRARARVAAAYRWADIVEGYERILRRAATGGYRGRPASDAAFRLPTGSIADTAHETEDIA